ncbi:MAG: D-glycero-beta-D-manno-heptose 1-phosphate adenylyltransferase [Bacteroidetes bacterium]|nr:D-glycero-beta-D-manno-heptose 1-phosphate adenylyltransferase [Bacteroidota bacterium]
MTDKLEIIRSKIITVNNIQACMSYYRFKEYRVVFTNGCFDIIHRGHIEYLAKAAGLGDVLIIGVNSDVSVRKIKGNSRPVQDENSRTLILAAMHFTDRIVLFDDETPAGLIRLIRPDILVKGGDYNEADIVGADIVKETGGQVVTIEFIEGYSSSDIIKRIGN